MKPSMTQVRRGVSSIHSEMSCVADVKHDEGAEGARDAREIRAALATLVALPQLLDALRPFAKLAQAFDGNPATDWIVRTEGGGKLVVGDLRKAQRALAQIEGCATP